MRIAVLAALLAVFTAAAVQAFEPPVEQLADAVVGAYYSPLQLAETEKATKTPIGSSDTTAIYTQSVSTSAVPLFNVDLAVANRLTTTVQALRITNRSASNTLCVWYKVLATDCTTTCSAAPLTCSGASTDGEPVTAGTALTVPITGELACVCGIASAASTTTTASRVVRDREK